MLAPGEELALGTESHRSGPASTNMFSDEKSSKKNKKKSATSTGGKEPEVVETSKNRRTTKEEDDLDKLEAELVPPAPHMQEKVQTQSEPAELVDEKDGEGEVVESVAAKKKRKKKEKEKEKKAAAKAAATTSAVEEVKQEEEEETNKSKVPDKKVPKHVRVMQESLARRKEAEEKKKQEEEDKLRKEEEERLRQEQLERLAEEKKQLQKEREKEKRLKKKAEGKLLTEKQKEDARRREAQRIQILADYQAKKSKQQHPPPPDQANAKAIDENTETKENQVSELEQEKKIEEEVEEMKMEEKSDVTDIMMVEQNNRIEEEEDEWDAKSWDDPDLKLPSNSSFADEEEESEPEPVVKKEIIKNTRIAAQASEEPFPPVAKRLLDKDAESSTENQLNSAVASENKQRQVNGKKEDPKKADGEKDLRPPIYCIMGHVDAGKTKLLDCIRGTNVQEGEAGGITQQIGATYFHVENIRERTKELKADAELNVPGILVIDTPGHESFANLRNRGSDLCDLAVLVVDIMHGLKPQTIESLKLLTTRGTKFIVALNKVDRLYGWKTCHNAPIVKAMQQQSTNVQLEFDARLSQVIQEFKEQGLNTKLYYENKKEMDTIFSIVPTSAISGEGIPDLLLLLAQWVPKTMKEKLRYNNEVECTVLEVKVIEGHGTTIDVVLVNGILHEGDHIVVCGMQGPIVTTIRALLTPHPLKELRVKGTYVHHKEIKATQGIKITAQGLENAIAGTSLYVVGPEDDVDKIKESVMKDMREETKSIDKSGEGVFVQASTLGSLEALLEFLKTPDVNIPVSGVGIGPVHKKDVIKAIAMLEKKKEFATILAFDVKVTPEARELADEAGVKIFEADIIYHLFDQFKAYIGNLKEEKKKEVAAEAVFPCSLKIIPNCVFNKKDPIILGVDVVEGIAKVGTPICVVQEDRIEQKDIIIDIGRITSIKLNDKPVDYAKTGQKVAIKIIGNNPEEQQKMVGRHFDIQSKLVSHISRESIDVLKAYYRENMSKDQWKLLLKLKDIFNIQ